MPPGRKHAPSQHVPDQNMQNDAQNPEQPIVLEDGVQGTSLPLEPAPASEKLQSEDSVPVTTTNPLVSDARSMASSPPRRITPRLTSLKSRKQPTTSLEDSAGSGPPTRPLKFLPKSALRRSKEVRDAAEKAEADRRQSRLTTEITSGIITGIRGRPQGRGGRGIGRGIGRPESDRSAGGQASGHLGGSTISEEGRKKLKVTRAGLRAGASEPSRSSARTKKDPVPKVEKDRIRNIVSSGGSTPKRALIKEETLGPTFASSDDESDIAEGPRVNIEHINLISDDEAIEEELEQIDQIKASLVESEKKVPGPSLKPIRVDRHEHVERAVGGNVDLSSMTSAQLRRRARERQEAEGSLFLSDGSPPRGTVHVVKSKSKTKDVEFVRDERRWKGVYQDEEGDAEPKVKEEPHDDDRRMSIDQVEPVASDPGPAAVGEGATTHDVGANPGPPPQTEAKNTRDSKADQSKRARLKKFELQSEEDRQEWCRREKELDFLREELGSIRFGLDRVAAFPTMTGEKMNSTADKFTDLPDRKEGHVYLFQLPPIAPQLLTTAENEVRLKAKGEPVGDASHTSQPLKTAAFTKFRSDLEDRVADKQTGSTSDIATTSDPPRTPGKIGTLRVYDSGRVKLEWGCNTSGSASMELRQGFRSSMLQEVVMTSYERNIVQAEGGDTEGTKVQAEGPEKERSKEQEKREEKINVGDTAWAIGELAGSFVMTPDWDKMFKC